MTLFSYSVSLFIHIEVYRKKWRWWWRCKSWRVKEKMREDLLNLGPDKVSISRIRKRGEIELVPADVNSLTGSVDKCSLLAEKS